MTEREMLLYNSLAGLHSLERAPKADVVRDLCGLQAQFSRNPQYSLWLRARDYAPNTWDDGLIKIWSHRGTIHVVAESELGLYLSAADCGGEYQEDRWGMSADEQARWAPFIAGQVRQGNDTRDGLKRACKAAGMAEELLPRAFYGWGGLIKEMCWRGQLACRTGTEKRYMVPNPPERMERDEARRVLIRRYFDHFGPATVQDCQAFFGYRMTELHPLLDEILPELHRTEIDGRTYYHARPLIEEAALPECVLLPGFDQLVMGYKDRSRYLDPANARKLVNIAGIVFPAVILRGKIRARWKLDGERLLVTPFERLLKKDEAAVRRTAKRELGRSVKQVVFLPAE
ncbi:MAG: winged helix DNA-binding domain-containing protein [Clostridia bacterium]|nr:winged helix DNA-binding domain-containing protein [Clostridia bacterium]